MFGNDPGRGISFFLFCAGCLVALSICVWRTFKVSTIHWGIVAVALAACLALACVCVAIAASISAAV
jgi:hypothetical protein